MNRILLIGLTPFASGINSFIKNTYPYFDHDLFSYDFLMMEQYRYKGKLSADFDVSGSNFYYLDFTREGMPKRSLSKLRDIILSIPNICGVHVHDINHMTYPLIIADQIGLPIKVMHFHTGYPKNNRKDYSIDEEAKKRLSLIRGDGFDRLACSDLAGDLGFQGMPYEIIPNGITPEKYAYNPLYRKIIREKLHIDNDAYVLGFFSNISANKNPIYALQVFQRFLSMAPGSILIFSGLNNSDMTTRSYVRDNCLEDSVIFLQTDDSIDMLYSAVDLILFTSFREGNSYVPIEAQASGLPCLISDAVTDMVKITDLAYKLPLDLDPDEWAKKALHILQGYKNRTSRTKEISDAGYHAKDVAKIIQNIYLRRLDPRDKKA